MGKDKSEKRSSQVCIRFFSVRTLIQSASIHTIAGFQAPAGGLTNARIILFSVILVAALAIYVAYPAATGTNSPKSSPESATAGKLRAPPKFLFRVAVGSEDGLPELDPLAVLQGIIYNLAAPLFRSLPKYRICTHIYCFDCAHRFYFLFQTRPNRPLLIALGGMPFIVAPLTKPALY